MESNEMKEIWEEILELSEDDEFWEEENKESQKTED